jgi:hypothetical protein
LIFANARDQGRLLLVSAGCVAQFGLIAQYFLAAKAFFQRLVLGLNFQ